MTLDLAEAGRNHPDLDLFVSLSRANESAGRIAGMGLPVFWIDGFTSGSGGLLRTLLLPRVIGGLRTFIRQHHIDGLVTMMPHIWTPFIGRAVRAAGSRYGVIIHDAESHPGDATGLLARWLIEDARRANRVFCLSRHVADLLSARGLVDGAALKVLFHPSMEYAGSAARVAPRPAGVPVRFLFLGRILRYKGLPLLAEAMDLLRQQGVACSLSVVGEGNLGPLRQRLAALGARIENRWVAHEEIGGILANHDAVVIPYIEASQSGVVAAALGAGRPVIVTPVGGLREQVADGETGLIAKTVSAAALAEAMARLAGDPGLLETLQRGCLAATAAISPARFLGQLADHLLSDDPHDHRQ